MKKRSKIHDLSKERRMREKFITLRTFYSGEWDARGFVDPELQAVHERRIRDLRVRELGLEMVPGNKGMDDE